MEDPDLVPQRDSTEMTIVAVRGDGAIERRDRLAGEEPMEIRAAGPGQEPVVIAVTMRTPGHDEELAAGFLFTEGLVRAGDVEGFGLGDPGLVAQPENHVLVRLRRPFDASEVAERHFVATASCGICGKASLDEVALRCDPIGPGPVVRRTTILALPERLRRAQAGFERTGALHASGLFTAGGDLRALREDVGRHNALDKLIGRALLDGLIPLRDSILLVSGRLSFELIQKAATAGIPIVCAISAPSDLAISAAERLHLTVVGFLRGDGFNVYAGRDRLDLGR